MPRLGAQVGPPPVITSQPQNQTARLGSDATFTVGAVSSTTLRYKWYFNGKNAGNGFGNGTPSYTVTNIQPDDAGTYYVEVRNASGAVLSSNAVLTAVSSPTTLASPHMTADGFSAQITGEAGATYVIEWSTNFTDWLPLATNAAPAGVVTFTDPTATSRAFTLYRARLL